jgi:NAD/NADP transhydrogenase beta subunit
VNGTDTAEMLRDAKSVIIVPGYGMPAIRFKRRSNE